VARTPLGSTGDSTVLPRPFSWRFGEEKEWANEGRKKETRKEERERERMDRVFLLI